MRFFPNSYGVLREYNPNHEPGGSAKGGQFAKKSGGAPGSVQSTGEPPHQPSLVDTTTGQPKFDPRQPPQEKHGLQIERPADTKKKAAAGGEHEKITDFTDNDDADAALQALGVSMSARDVAQGMVSAIEGETFEVQVSTHGDGGSRYDGPDPTDVRSDYEEWSGERMSEAESDMHDSERRDFLSYSEGAYLKAGDAANDAIHAHNDGRFVNADVWDKATKDMTPEEEAAFQHTNALAERLFDKDNGVVNEEGLFRGTTAERSFTKRIVDEYIDEHPDAKFLPLPDADGAPGQSAFDRDYRAEHSKWFNNEDGFSNWLDDGQGSDAGENIPTFDSWYADQYGHSPDKYGESGSYGEDAEVEFVFSGSNGSHITRTFSMKDGELHVHHDYFSAGGTGDGLSKQFYQGALPTYDKMGVHSISTLADIDVGAYTWARFGFTPDNPYSIAQRVESRGKKLFKDSGLFDDADWASFTSLIDRNEKSFLWDVADAKYYTTPEKAQALMGNWMRRGSYGSAVISNKKTREEAAKGIVSVGRLAMVDDNGNMHWEGTLDLHDEESVRRLEGYVGVWRAGRGGLRTDPTPAPPSGPRSEVAAIAQRMRQREDTERANQANIDAANAIHAKAGRFNAKMDRYNAASSRPLSQPQANKVWQRVQRGVPFERAVQDFRRKATP
jgi:hypothetical protein